MDQATRNPDPEPRTPHVQFALTRPQALYVWISGVFITSLVVANMIGSKLFRFELDLTSLGLGVIPVEHTTGMIPFPITFLLTDLVNEYYGRKATRRVTYIAFAMAALAFVFIAAARAVPILEGIPGTATKESFENIFGQASLMYIASVIAFLAGSLLDIQLFGVFKRLTGDRFVWFRATGSTVVSQIFDSFVVTWVFFQGLPMLLNKPHADFRFVLSTATTGYILKFFIALALTPLIYLGRWMIREWFGMKPVPVDA